MSYEYDLEDVDLGGLSPSLAVPVETNSDGALAFEQTYLEKRFGTYGLRWWHVVQGVSRFNGRWLDQLHIVVDGWPLCIYFDVTKVFEKTRVRRPLTSIDLRAL